MNKIILKGRSTRSPEVKFIQTDQNGQQCYAKFILAVEDYSFKDKETGNWHVDYIPCNCFGKTAEIIKNNVKKGTELLVSGKWRSSSFMKNNQMEYRNSLQILEVEFCGKKQENNAKQDKPIHLYWETSRQVEQDTFNVEEELAKLKRQHISRQTAVN